MPFSIANCNPSHRINPTLTTSRLHKPAKIIAEGSTTISLILKALRSRIPFRTTTVDCNIIFQTHANTTVSLAKGTHCPMPIQINPPVRPLFTHAGCQVSFVGLAHDGFTVENFATINCWLQKTVRTTVNLPADYTAFTAYILIGYVTYALFLQLAVAITPTVPITVVIRVGTPPVVSHSNSLALAAAANRNIHNIKSAGRRNARKQNTGQQNNSHAKTFIRQPLREHNPLLG
jgi:hypothetical protein